MRISFLLHIILLTMLINTTNLATANEDINLIDFASYTIETNTKVIWHPVHDWITLNLQETTAITIIDAQNGQELYTLQTPSPVPSVLGANDFTWSENGEFLAVSFRLSNKIDVWHYADDEITFQTQIVFGSVSDYDTNPMVTWDDNKLLVVVGNDIGSNQRQILMWDDTFEEIILQSDMGEEIQPYSIMPNIAGEYLATYGFAFDPTIIWYSTIVILDKLSFEDVSIFPIDYELSPSQQPIWYNTNVLIGISCTTSFDGCRLWKWNIHNNQIITLLDDVNEDSVSLSHSRISLNTNYDVLAVGDSGNQAIHIVELASGNLILSLEYVPDFIQSVDWNATGEMLVVNSGNVVQIWKIL